LFAVPRSSYDRFVERHLTVSGFVVHEGRVALHWHRKIGAWLPAGGHIEPGEDPVTAVLREVREEFALEAEIIPLAPRVDYSGGPLQIEPPFTVLDCWPEPGHGHVDLVYFCRVLAGYPGVSHDRENPIVWLDAAALAAGSVPNRGVDTPLPPDVQALSIEALRLAERAAVVTQGAP
jgi:8-oxo-dGTP pyrophosphatase MutT (NUDIX family)